MKPSSRRALCAVVIVIVLTSIGCGARLPEGPRFASTQADVEALMERGCFECLRAAYETATQAGLNQSAFESALLLATRSKELGLAHAAWVEAARQQLPSPDWQRYLDIVLSLPIDPMSGDREAIFVETARYRRPREVLEEWRRDLANGPANPIVRAYLDLSIACGPLLYDVREAAIETAISHHSSVPLIRYRVGLCGRTAMLADIREPDLVDADLELGRAALARERADQEEALRRFQSAGQAFSTSPTIISAIGTLLQQREEWAPATEAYDRVLALTPTHRDALLGRTISLSHAGRYDDAIASASRLIDLGGWFIADALYWRAWNRYQLNDMRASRMDIDESKAAAPEPGTLLLSGLIAWRQQELDLAESELSAALTKDFGYCEAALYLGQVRADDRRWPESLAALAHAEQCLTLSIETREQAIATLSTNPQDNARQIASHQRSIRQAQERRESGREVARRVQQRIARAR